MFLGPSADRAARPGGGLPASVSRGLLVVAGLLVSLVLLFGVQWAAAGTGELRVPGAALTAVLRTVLFAALAVLAGELMAPRFVASVPGRPGSNVRSWAVVASLLGVAAAAGQIFPLAAAHRLGITETCATREGALLLVVAAALALAAFCAAGRSSLLALFPLAIGIGAEALRAHPEPYRPLIGAALTVVHLTAASLWAGSLLYVLRTMWLWRQTPGAARALLMRYARVAIWLYAALVATGTVSTLRRLPLDVVFISAYGRLLLVKLGLMALVTTLALLARRQMLRAPDPQLAHRLARREQSVLVLVLAVSALLTVAPDPHWISTG
ncbi:MULTISPECIES: CopD family protein [unclassified Streptomyces]|uniref:CopD family protein n=1 Tax=unclassified Streptomyces TaxID=2593676 RepID=UPI000823D5A1|nr:MULTISPECIES: CopD family protein [unclassified Streptomyces]MYT96985.1 copper resistance protein CopD [Streptomyces sp. SID8350]SCK63331.1 Putative copper export protein [Streptomyces sp. AmelKG-D3]